MFQKMFMNVRDVRPFVVRKVLLCVGWKKNLWIICRIEYCQVVNFDYLCMLITENGVGMMKRLCCLLLMALFVSVAMRAETYIERMEHIYNDTIEVSLLTCSPGNEAYSLYGHTAIRFHNFTTDEDWTFNYGVFNFRQKNFVLKFAFGKTDYELGMFPMDAFMVEYRKEGRAVTEQVLNLTQEQKVNLFSALYDNWRPENCQYRYNFFRDNCTTRARDIIFGAVNCDTCSIVVPAIDGRRMTWRENLHIYTDGHVWDELGDDLALGQPADDEMSDDERQFLPFNLMDDFGKATIRTADGEVPLVVETRTILDAGDVSQSGTDGVTPLQTIAILALIIVVVFLVEIKKKKIFLALDVVLLLLIGVAGIVMTVLACSDHPATFFNWQILILTPLALVSLPFVVKATRRRTLCWWDAYLVAAVVVLFVVGLAGVQDVPMFTLVLAGCLLTRSLVRRIIFRTFASNHKKE